MKRRFSLELIKEYGEQTYRDYRRTRQTIEDCSWTSVEVAISLREVKAYDREIFQKEIVKYALTTKFPINFI